MLNSQDQLIADMLVLSVGCGDAELEAYLQSEAANAYMLTPSACTTRQRYLNAQLAMIELGQVWTRNRIDIAKTRRDQNGGERFDSKNEKDAEGKRQSQATAESWSKAQSFQQFKRDSEAHDRANSDSEAHTRANAFSFMQDRSKQDSKGWSRALALGFQYVDGDGDSGNHSTMTHTSSSETKTAPMTAYVAPVPRDQGACAAAVAAWGATGLLASPPGCVTDIPPSYTPQTNRAPVVCIQDPANPDIDPTGCAVPLPSYGRGFRKKVSGELKLTFFNIFSVALEFGFEFGQSFRQSHVCSKGRTTTNGTNCSRDTFAQLTSGRDLSVDQSDDRSINLRDVHRTAESHRKQTSKTDATTTGTSDSCGESHTGSDRTSHSEGQGTSGSTARSESHAEAKGEGFRDMTMSGESRRYGQIFDSLNDLWKRVFAEIQDLDAMATATVAPSIGRLKCAPCNPKTAVVNELWRRSVNPCLGACAPKGKMFA